ncbi:hypothetical protein [Vibrio campbellii]|uniref:hypothetical protein n=1 Tax=Vibrio campbellii TaxID=680 RepID=UPI000CD3601C|nr:hypothetical protein [Vibrio campbellii]AUW07352.1 hypothetical protein C1N51_27185 [Vibrio campbellii]
MRLTINGAVGKQELLESFSRLLNSLEDAGVNEFKGVNLYFNTYISGKKVFPYFDGKEANILHNSQKEHITTDVDDSGKKTIKYQSGVKGCDIDLDSRLTFDSNITLPTAEMIAEERREELEREQAERELEQAEYEEKRRQKREAEEAEQAIERACVAVLKDKLCLSEQEFKLERSSMGWVKSRKGIDKYSVNIKEERVFRISMKIKGSSEKKAYLFSEKAELVFE